MLNYADYTYYTSTYKGTLLSNSLFDFYIGKASRIIDEVTNQPITQELLNQYEVIKYVACELTELVNNNESAGNIASKSIDGVSLTYNNNAKSEFNTQKTNVLNHLPHELIRFL